MMQQSNIFVSDAMSLASDNSILTRDRELDLVLAVILGIEDGDGVALEPRVEAGDDAFLVANDVGLEGEQETAFLGDSQTRVKVLVDEDQVRVDADRLSWTRFPDEPRDKVTITGVAVADDLITVLLLATSC